MGSSLELTAPGCSGFHQDLGLPWPFLPLLSPVLRWGCEQEAVSAQAGSAHCAPLTPVQVSHPVPSKVGISLCFQNILEKSR